MNNDNHDFLNPLPVALFPTARETVPEIQLLSPQDKDMASDPFYLRVGIIDPELAAYRITYPEVNDKSLRIHHDRLCLRAAIYRSWDPYTKERRIAITLDMPEMEFFAMDHIYGTAYNWNMENWNACEASGEARDTITIWLEDKDTPIDPDPGRAQNDPQSLPEGDPTRAMREVADCIYAARLELGY